MTSFCNFSQILHVGLMKKSFEHSLTNALLPLIKNTSGPEAMEHTLSWVESGGRFCG